MQVDWDWFRTMPMLQEDLLQEVQAMEVPDKHNRQNNDHQQETGNR